REPGPLRQHVGRVDPARGGRGAPHGPHQAGQPGGIGDLRRRLHVGRRGGAMVKAAFLFPGQGSQSVGMGKALAERYPEARAAFDEADHVLGLSLSKLCFEGPEAELTKTENTQPALLAASVAALRVLESKGIVPSAAAGHSAGEYGAHVAAGTFSYADGLRLIRARGLAMSRAGQDRPGSMAAVL